jgi:hypothetical protein
MVWLVVAAVLALADAQNLGTECVFGVPNEAQPQGCFLFDMSALPTQTWDVNTSTCPENCNLFKIGRPCGAGAATAGCSDAGSVAKAPAYQVSNLDEKCRPLGAVGAPSFGVFDVANISSGLILSHAPAASGRRCARAPIPHPLRPT